MVHYVCANFESRILYFATILREVYVFCIHFMLAQGMLALIVTLCPFLKWAECRVVIGTKDVTLQQTQCC